MSGEDREGNDWGPCRVLLFDYDREPLRPPGSQPFPLPTRGGCVVCDAWRPLLSLWTSRTSAKHDGARCTAAAANTHVASDHIGSSG